MAVWLQLNTLHSKDKAGLIINRTNRYSTTSKATVILPHLSVQYPANNSTCSNSYQSNTKSVRLTSSDDDIHHDY